MGVLWSNRRVKECGHCGVEQSQEGRTRKLGRRAARVYAPLPPATEEVNESYRPTETRKDHNQMESPAAPGPGCCADPPGRRDVYAIQKIGLISAEIDLPGPKDEGGYSDTAGSSNRPACRCVRDQCAFASDARTCLTSFGTTSTGVVAS